MANKYLSLIRKRPGFRNLWLASLVSLIGDWFNTIASVMIVNQYTETDLAISWILIARTLPRFLLIPFSGALADRVNRKVIMVAADILRAGIVLSFLWVDRPERVWLIYVLTVAQFVAASFFEPASSAIIPSLVKGQEELMTANVLSSITWSAMLAVGAALGGVFAGIFGAQTALIADALTFLVSASFLMGIRYTGISDQGESTTRRFRELAAGFRYVIEKPRVGLLTLVKTMGQIGSADIFVIVLAEQYFPVGEQGAISLGFLFGMMGLGAIIGPLAVDKITGGEPVGLQKVIHAGYSLIPIGWLLMAWSPNLWIGGVGVLIRLMGTSINWTYSNVLIQTEVPDRYRGRVFALDLGLFTLATSIATFLTGYSLDQTSLNLQRLGYYLALGSLLPIFLWGLSRLGGRKNPDRA
ncbi:MAG: MFS transporter [Anaerolineales bacterium]|nr:MFS transporter [Anaerolineales bacterium]